MPSHKYDAPDVTVTARVNEMSPQGTPRASVTVSGCPYGSMPGVDVAVTAEGGRIKMTFRLDAAAAKKIAEKLDGVASFIVTDEVAWSAEQKLTEAERKALRSYYRKFDR